LGKSIIHLTKFYVGFRFLASTHYSLEFSTVCLHPVFCVKFVCDSVLTEDMMRNYQKKTQRGSYGSENLQQALEAVKNGTPLIKASKQFCIPARTLRRHRDGKVQCPGSSKLGGHAPVLSAAVEKELHDHIKFMEKSLYGLTPMDVRRLAYEIAESIGVKHPFNKSTKMAGQDWMQQFFRRHSDLSIRIPEGTSLSHAVAFNMPKVDQFLTSTVSC